MSILTSSGESENDDDDDDPLVCRQVIPVIIPAELVVSQGRMLALLDLGCVRCVVSPEVMEKLGAETQMHFANWIGQ